MIGSFAAEPRLPQEGLVKLGLPGAQSSSFMASNLPPQMLLESFGTVVYTLDSGIFFEDYSFRSAVFRLNRPTSFRM